MANGKIISLESKRLEKSFQAAMKAAASSKIPTQSQYEANEARETMAKERQIEKAPLHERKEAQAAFLEAMAERPDTVAERIDWLLDGNYGFGEMQAAKRILGSPRMNREAALTQLVAVHEWMCPRRMAAEAWKKLSGDQKAKLSKAIEKVIRNAEKSE